MKEFNVIEMGKKVDIVPHSKRLSPWIFFNLSTLQPINSLYFFTKIIRYSNNYETKVQKLRNQAKQILTLWL